MLLFNFALGEGEERDKLAEIYKKYLDWMLKIAYHYLQNQEDAEDAVANVFVSLAGTSSQIPMDKENDTKSYLFICIRNSAFNLKKSKAKHNIVSFDTLFNIPSKQTPEEDVEKLQDYESLFCFINSMNVIYKDVLTLYIKFGMSLKEIAKALHVPPKTVQTRFLRGKAILKERFGDIEI